MKVSALASGSNGNSTLVMSEKAHILIDIGISLKELTKRLSNLGLKNEEIDAVFVSHEHIDHIRGVGIFSRKYDVPVYMNKPTFEEAQNIVGSIDNITFIGKTPVTIKDLKIECLEKSHDAVSPISFIVTNNSNNKKIGIITDLGFADDKVKQAIKDMNCIVLESNHDVTMLRNGSYPPALKKRIEGKFGHLSNDDAALLLLEHASSKLQLVMLAHLSENNNHPQLAYDTFKSVLKLRYDLDKVDLYLTNRHKETELIAVK